MNIIAIGDVVGIPGIEMLERSLRPYKKLKNIDFTIVNGENASGLGITPSQAQRIFDAGADVITLGNHTWNRPEITEFLDDCRYILRPANFSRGCPGRGYEIYDCGLFRVCVINLVGRCFMDFNTENPFKEAESIVESVKDGCDVICVDFHAEATSEKLAMGFHLDGRVSVVFGTHTHVQTADDCVFENGMGYVTDLGMTGPVRSILGVNPCQPLSVFLGGPPKRYETASAPCKMCGVIFEVEPKTGKCLGTERFEVR